MRPALPALLLLAALAAGPALARPPTPEERAGVEAALRAAGYEAWESVEIAEGGDRIVVSGARRAAAGPRYELVVAPDTMRVAQEIESGR